MGWLEIIQEYENFGASPARRVMFPMAVVERELLLRQQLCSIQTTPKSNVMIMKHTRINRI